MDVAADTTVTEKRGLTIIEDAGDNMEFDYMDYLKHVVTGYSSGGFNGMFQSMYDYAYDNSHGSDRYWLTKVPWFSTWRKYKDEAKQAQDRWDNTHIDEAYIDRVIGNGGSSLNADLGNSVGRAAKMARSLSSVYVPEVIEDVSSKFNYSLM